VKCSTTTVCGRELWMLCQASKIPLMQKVLGTVRIGVQLTSASLELLQEGVAVKASPAQAPQCSQQLLGYLKIFHFTDRPFYTSHHCFVSIVSTSCPPGITGSANTLRLWGSISWISISTLLDSTPPAISQGEGEVPVEQIF